MYVHTSPDADLEKNWVPGGGFNHVFGGVLFFTYAHDVDDAASAYRMSEASKYVYAIDEDNVHLATKWDLDLDDDVDYNTWDGQCELVNQAVEQGYHGAIDEDEQGTVYCIDIDAIGIETMRRIV